MKNGFLIEAIKVTAIMSVAYFAICFVTDNLDSKMLKDFSFTNLKKELKQTEKNIKPHKNNSNKNSFIASIVKKEDLSWQNFEKNINKKIDEQEENSKKWKEIYKKVNINTDKLDITKLFFE